MQETCGAHVCYLMVWFCCMSVEGSEVVNFQNSQVFEVILYFLSVSLLIWNLYGSRINSCITTRRNRSGIRSQWAIQTVPDTAAIREVSVVMGHASSCVWTWASIGYECPCIILIYLLFMSRENCAIALWSPRLLNRSLPKCTACCVEAAVLHWCGTLTLCGIREC